MHMEKQLLLRVAAGDETAFRQLFYQYHHQLGIFIYQLTASRELAEEIVQDVFLKIWTTRGELTGVTHFKAWVYVLCRNHALNALRGLLREKQRHQQWCREHTYVIQHGEDEFSDASFQLLDQAIRQLPPQQRRVFILNRYHRLSYQEIAGRLNLSRETVKYYLRLAVQAITQYITQHSYLLLLALFSAH
jgi:RNA polymerase sigma-70 factor (family 1)